jgi:hypothetical protein
MKKTILYVIRLYQKIFSPDSGIIRQSGLVRGPSCSFYPTCSDYMIQAITKYGVAGGFLLGAKRIIRCHPWQKEHFDPVP